MLVVAGGADSALQVIASTEVIQYSKLDDPVSGYTSHFVIFFC